MKFSTGQKAILFILISGVLAIIVLRLFQIVPPLDDGTTWLILIVVALSLLPCLFPLFSEFSFAGFQFKKEHIENADRNDVEEDERLEDEALKHDKKNSKAIPPSKEIRKTIFTAIVRKENLKTNSIRDNQQIISNGDEIAELNPVFSWYFPDEQRLYEAKFSQANQTYHNKLYVMLSKIQKYNNQNRAHLRLRLYLVKKDSEATFGVQSEEEKIIQSLFLPAINSGILEVRELSSANLSLNNPSEINLSGDYNTTDTAFN